METLVDANVTVPCPICGSVSDSTLMLFKGYRIARCLTCDFIFLNPRPAEDRLVGLYANHRQNPYFAEGYEPVEYERPVLAKIVSQIETYVPHGHLLEIGCGRGDFLKLAQTRGFSVTGCDIFDGHKPALDGISFFDGTLKEAGFGAESFDVVVIRNVLEHLFDPNSEIREIRRILKPNGHLYLKVPNVEFEHGFNCRLVFGKEHAFEPPYHLNYFSPASLQAFLGKAGFSFRSWYLEQPTLTPKWTSNLIRQTGYRVIQTVSFLTGGKSFPKILLSCVAQKREAATGKAASINHTAAGSTIG
jgi:SAM-dependent methyltransferase